MVQFKINNKIFNEVECISTVVADCAVKRNKLVTEKNKSKDKPSSGESRIYVSSQEAMKQSKFFEFPKAITYLKNTFAASDDKICFCTSENLMEYMNEAHSEYVNPTLNFFYDISVDYEVYRRKIESLESLEYFSIFNHKGKKDSARFYINSLDDIWTTLRSIALPQITFLNIHKLKNEVGEILYFFELVLDEKHSSRNKIEREEKIVEDIINNTNIATTERNALIKARNGQGKFRNNCIAIMKFCPFTGISDRTLLRASHIKPWVECENNNERLDGWNGLTLTPTYDVLFDKGLISFKNDGSLILSSLLTDDIKDNLHLKSGEKYNISNDSGNRNRYLEYHRNNILKK